MNGAARDGGASRYHKDAGWGRGERVSREMGEERGSRVRWRQGTLQGAPRAHARATGVRYGGGKEVRCAWDIRRGVNVVSSSW